MRKKRSHKVTMTAVAKRAGVSQSTVSRALNAPETVNAEVAAAVNRAAAALGYLAPAAHHPGQTAATITVGLLLCPLPEQDNPLGLSFFAEMVAGLQEEAATTDTELVLLSLRPGAEALEMPPRRLNRFSGFVAISHPAPGLLASLRATGKPLVVVSGQGPADDDPAIDYVTSNHFLANALACRYFLQRGQRRIGAIVARCFADRLDGIRVELLRHGLAMAEADLRVVATTANSDFVAAAASMPQDDFPPALIVGFYSAALAVREYLEKQGIAPAVRIFTFTHLASQAAFPCVRENPRELGRKGLRRLRELVAHPDDTPQIEVLPVVFAPAGDDEARP